MDFRIYKLYSEIIGNLEKKLLLNLSEFVAKLAVAFPQICMYNSLLRYS